MTTTTTTTTTIIEADPDGIPELREWDQWVCWRLEKRGSKVTKVPYNARTGRLAKSTDSETWSTFEDAISALESDGYDGIGFVFSSSDPFTGIDLDHCVDSETGEIAVWAREWVAHFDSYTERSPSGDGLHIIVRGKTPHDGKTTVDGKTVEIYSAKRFFTITGTQI